MWLLLQAEMAPLPQWDGELPGCAVQENPTCPFPLVLAGGAGQAQPAPRANTARATAFPGVPRCWKHTWPWSCTMDRARPAPHCLHTVPNPTSSDALSVLASQAMCLMGQGQGSLIRSFSSAYIWWGLLPFCGSSWTLF